MEVLEIGGRGYLFTFYDLKIPTNVYVIVGESKFYFIDTYLGSSYMEKIHNYLLERFGDRKNIVFNTHSDWDHIWGNEYFKDAIIVGSNECFQNIAKRGKQDLNQFSNYAKEEINIVNLNTVFKGDVEFLKDGIQAFQSYGHTEDSISIYDSIDKVLHVGDNVELPIPHVQDQDLDSYIESLEAYKEIDFKYLIGGHTGLLKREDIDSNIEYLRALKEGNSFNFEEEIMEIHMKNLEYIGK